MNSMHFPTRLNPQIKLIYLKKYVKYIFHKKKIQFINENHKMKPHFFESTYESNSFLFYFI